MYSQKGQGCTLAPCGTNANCRETLGGRPVCSCPAGYSGNPLTYCRRAECLDHTECAGHLSCRNGNCVDPCIGTCGSNANCEVSIKKQNKSYKKFENLNMILYN